MANIDLTQIKQRNITPQEYVRQKLSTIDKDKPVIIYIEDNSKYFSFFKEILDGTTLPNQLEKPKSKNIFLTTSIQEDSDSIINAGGNPLYAGHPDIIKEMVSQLNEMNVDCLVVFDVNFKELFEHLDEDSNEEFSSITLLYDLYELNPHIDTMGVTMTADKADQSFAALRRDLGIDIPLESKQFIGRVILIFTRKLYEATLRMNEKKSKEDQSFLKEA